MKKVYSGHEITSLQYIFLLSGIQVGVAVLSLPRKLAETAGTDGWISIIIGWLISTAASLIIVQIMKNSPNGSLPDWAAGVMGMWAGKAVAFLLALYFCFLLFDGLTKTVMITKIWLLPNTPSYIIMILLLVPTYMIARHGPRIVGRYCELIVYICLWIPIIYLIPLKHSHFLHLLPPLKEGWQPVLTGVKEIIYPSLGMVATFVLYPFLKHKEKAGAAVVASNTLTMASYLFITLICFVYYSPDEITEYNNPVISILKSIEFRFIERIEVPFIAFYLTVFSLVWIPAMYLTTFCSSWLFGRTDSRGHLRVLCIATAIATYFYTPTYRQNWVIEQILTAFGLGIEYIFPVLLLAFIAVHNRMRRS
ncbi:spore germination protein [Paenibacillus oenotherae]|uniref:Spore germination protein n=1 Tax=Paenibacillus oenotherae TaxID=1435645 RepID=A0ABS7D360_9BACL|nr:endospore germination permease [Paenibacillus oenotherae]MBW7474283.1 spore germination protein [Paenibacillus oenotherae]